MRQDVPEAETHMVMLRSETMARKPTSVEVVDEGSQRVVLITWPDGTVLRTLTKKPTRRPRKPVARARVPSLPNKK